MGGLSSHVEEVSFPTCQHCPDIVQGKLEVFFWLTICGRLRIPDISKSWCSGSFLESGNNESLGRGAVFGEEDP